MILAAPIQVYRTRKQAPKCMKSAIYIYVTRSMTYFSLISIMTIIKSCENLFYSGIQRSRNKLLKIIIILVFITRLSNVVPTEFRKYIIFAFKSTAFSNGHYKSVNKIYWGIDYFIVRK